MWTFDRQTDRERGRKWVPSPDSAVYIFCGGILKVAVYPSSPLPPTTHSLIPPSHCWPAAPCISRQISPTVGSAGLCGGLFILERGLPSGSLHLSKHPPGRCSVFPASHSLPAAPLHLLSPKLRLLSRFLSLSALSVRHLSPSHLPAAVRPLFPLFSFSAPCLPACHMFFFLPYAHFSSFLSPVLFWCQKPTHTNTKTK